MTPYRIYIDETGNHDLEHADDPNQRFFALTGVILDGQYTKGVLQPEMQALKRKYFIVDPDVPVIFHRKEMVNKRPPFHVLREHATETAFNQDLLEHLARWDFRAITVVLDKKAHREQYTVWRYHPYHYCLAVMLERYVLFLLSRSGKGDVMVESRGGKEDLKLKDSYSRLFEKGTDYVQASTWQKCLTSHELKAKPKSANIEGLQLADLIAHPSRREVLLEHGLLKDERSVFGENICEVLREHKYLRSPRGVIEGYGKKLLA
jgi:hypothetical protein